MINIIIDDIYYSESIKFPYHFIGLCTILGFLFFVNLSITKYHPVYQDKRCRMDWLYLHDERKMKGQSLEIIAWKNLSEIKFST